MKSTKILICPLDWGLGHATRSIPVIRAFVARGHEVRIASSGPALALLQKEFPELPFSVLPGYSPTYSTSGSQWLSIARQSSKFLNTIRAEHKELERLVKQENISCVISDNRFGCWSSQVPSVMITHQLHIPVPAWFSPLVNRVNHYYLRKFSAVWVPDWAEDSSLTGSMTLRPPVPATFIGPLSRFRLLGEVETKYEVLAILSGPEPQRTLLEEILRPQLRNLGKRSLLVRGLPELSESFTDGGVEEVSFLGSAELNQAILASEVVVSRSGYSTVMDMATLARRAIFIPTPGQPEQEYLSTTLMERKICLSLPQARLDLRAALVASADYSGFPQGIGVNVLEEAIDHLGL